jgi:hypothetical protein
MQEAKTGNGGPEGPDGGLGAWVAAHAPRYHEEARACARLAAAANRGDFRGSGGGAEAGAK